MPNDNITPESLLAQYLTDYDRTVWITDGYDFDQEETINKIELYRASKFVSGNVDSQGTKKFFYNILNPQAGTITKNIDLDVKDVLFRSRNAKNRVKSMIARERFQIWAKKHKFGVFLNKLSETLPIYGSFIAEKVGKDVQYSPLKWLKFDPAVEDISKSPYVIKEMFFQPEDLEKMTAWDQKAVKEVVKRHRKNLDPEIKVYKLNCEAPANILDGKGSKFVKGEMYIAAQIDKDDKKEDSAVTKVLYVTQKKNPYKKINLFNVDGRALGLGIFEMLFDMQERRNEMFNQKSKQMKISSKKLFMTKDNLLQSNILTDLLDGDIIKGDVQPIAVEDRNLASYAQEEQNIEANVRSNANAFEIITGENLPSRTPFRLGALLNQNAGKLFDYIRENVGLFLKEVIEDWIMPEFRKELTTEQVFEIFDAETLELIVANDSNRRLNDAVKKYVLKTGKFPTEVEMAFLKGKMKDEVRDSEFVKIKEGFLDFKFDVDVVITGESYDIAQRVETTSNMLQLLAQNPQIMQDEQLKKLLLSMAEDVGISPRLLNSSGKSAPLASLGQTQGQPSPLGGGPPLSNNTPQ